MQEYIERHEEKALAKQLGGHPSGQASGGSNPWSKVDAPTCGVGDNRPASTTAPPTGTQQQQTKAGGASILLCLLRLRQCCGHLSLMKDVSNSIV